MNYTTKQINNLSKSLSPQDPIIHFDIDIYAGYGGWAYDDYKTPFKEGLFPAGHAGVIAALAMVCLGVLKHVTYRALPTAMIVAPIMTIAKYKIDREDSSSKCQKYAMAACVSAIIAGTAIVPKLSSMVLKNRVGYLEAFAQSLVGTAAVFAAQVHGEDQD